MKIKEKLEKMKELMNSILYTDLDTDKLWLSHLYQANGYLQDSIRAYMKSPQETKVSPDWGKKI